MEIYKMMIMSTKHVSKTTSHRLDSEQAGVVVYQKDSYGWFIVVTDWRDNEDDIPEDLARCLSLAEENGCDWLCLDCDAEVYKNIPVCNW